MSQSLLEWKYTLEHYYNYNITFKLLDSIQSKSCTINQKIERKDPLVSVVYSVNCKLECCMIDKNIFYIPFFKQIKPSVIGQLVFLLQNRKSTLKALICLNVDARNMCTNGFDCQHIWTSGDCFCNSGKYMYHQ
jgi:hypothetical protein